MEKAEAIKIIKMALAQIEWDYPMDYAAAFDMAIEALEQEPTTKNDVPGNNVGKIAPTTKNDLAVDCIVDVLGSYTDLDIPYKREIAENILTKLPSVTPREPKAGHWIDCDNSEDYSADGYDCSVCGVNAEYATSYCPNCGAKMVEPQESEDKE